MKLGRIVSGSAAAVLLALGTVTGEPVEVGISRADLIAKHGNPLGAISGGSREILTYPEGRVTVEKGVVTRFEVSSSPASQAAPVASATARAKQVDPMQPRVDPRAAKAGWISSLDEAIAQATAQDKPILFLLSGNMNGCPWGKQFNETVEYSDSFIRKIRSEFIPLRINLSEMGGSMELDSKEEVDRMARKVEEFVHMRREIFASNMVPGLAILTPDGRQSTEVDMSGALAAVARGELDNYTLKQLAVARDTPRKEVKVYRPPIDKSKFGYAALGLVLIGWLIKKLKK